MTCQFDYRRYRRPFRQPIHTHHGVWNEREGVILRLRNDKGQVGFGEIAPLPDFGSESLDSAIDWCQSLASVCTTETICSIPSNLPACQFGFESAWEMITVPDHSSCTQHHNPYTYCRLLSTGKAALNSWAEFYKKGDRTFKWKIGVAPIQAELEWFETLMQHLPPDAALRLDANGGLTWDDASRWLDACDRFIPLTSSSQVAHVEFLEQPLPPTQFEALLHLSRHHQTPIALDESVATLAQLQECCERGWAGIVVVKAAIAGYPSHLREFCKTHQLDVVWSSVLETAIARHYVLNHLVSSIPDNGKALGFGVEQWFRDSQMDTAVFDANHLFEL